MKMRSALLIAAVLTAGLVSPPALAQRDAAFVQPSQASGGKQKRESDDIFAATPADIDVGETIVGVTKRVNLFFTNFGSKPVTISSIEISADSNVRTAFVQNDCQEVGTVKGNDRCATGLEITPNSPGAWTAEVVVIHDAPGRATRAVILGNTAGEVGNTGQQPGLSLIGSNKDQLIDFDTVEVGIGRSVRSVLLANDSPGPLTIEKIELVAADRGLKLLDEGGCKEGLEVPAGGSCPITMMWQPLGRGDVSTDLIIRHTGPVGFAVIPVRGKVGGAATDGGGGGGASTTASLGMTAEEKAAALPLPATGGGAKIPSISNAALFARAAGGVGGNNKLTLRGTVGERALLADADGKVVVARVGEVITSEGVAHRVVSVQPTKVELNVEGAKVDLVLSTITSEMRSSGSRNKTTPTSGAAPPPAK